MFVSSWRGSWPVVLAGLGLATPVYATDPNRMLLLAAEAASATQGTAPTGAGSPWLWALVVVGTLASAFAGAYLGLRRFSIGHIRADGDFSISHVRADDDWREVTYRFKAKGPLKYGTNMLETLNGVVGELERMTPKGDSRPHPTSPPAPPPEPVTPAEDVEAEALAAAKPVEGAKEERTDAYQRARRLLADGTDEWTVRELTGLKFAELDLLTSASGNVPPTKPDTARTEP